MWPTTFTLSFNQHMNIEASDMNTVSALTGSQQHSALQQGVIANRRTKSTSTPFKLHQVSGQEESRIARIGAQIKTLRIRSGYTSAEIFAYEHDLNRISYWRMEKGSNITMTSLFRILDIHKITLREFFKDID